MVTRSLLENKNQSVIDALEDCVEACNSCIVKDLKEHDVMMMVRCIQLDQDCAEICTLTIQYLSRGSEFAHPMTNQCVTICDTCAAECEKHTDMPHCLECAKICRKCADECRKLGRK
jgi:hypothetical protein